jgi:hypothetical protein
MSTADARYADEALNRLPLRRLTVEQQVMARREKTARTVARMTAAVANLVTMNGNVTRRDLVEQGFTAGEIDRYFRRAIKAAGIESMVS